MSKLNNQLMVMFECLLGERKNDKVATGLTSGSKLRYALAVVEEYGEVTLVEQNPHTNSIFADATRNGSSIAWLFKGSKYAGPVVARLSDSPAIKVLTGKELRTYLNPIGELV